MIEKKNLVPLFMSALNIIFGFIFFALITRENIEYLGIFSFVHGGSIILSHFFRFGTDFDIFKNSSDLKKIYGEEDSIVSHIIIFNILCLSFLIIFHLFFNISSMIFYTIMMALTLSLNIVISNFFRRRNYILLYSMFLNSPFIIATAGLFFLPIINSFTAINIFLGAFYLLIIFELFFLKFYFKFNFFEKINFRNIRPIFINLYPTFISGVILLFMEQLPVLAFGWAGDFESAAIFKILSKICVVLVIISNAFFASAIPEISITNPKNLSSIELIYNRASFKAFILSSIYMLAIFLFLPIIINIFSTEISYSNLIFLFLGNLIIVFSGPVNQALIIFNLQKYLMKILLISFLITSPLTIILIFNYGLLGAIISLILFNLFWIVPSLFKFYLSNKINLYLPYYCYQKLVGSNK